MPEGSLQPLADRTDHSRYYAGVSVVAGGFPCQDISVAGGRAGITGGRSGLWRNMVGAVRVVQPLYALVENVAALLGSGMGRVLGDLADEGYDAEWDCISACAVGRPTLRQRLWIVAESMRARRQGRIKHVGPLSFAPTASTERRDQALRERTALEHDFRGVRADHGFSVTMERKRIQQFGNAVVPQIPELIGRAILEAEKADTGGYWR